MKGGATRHLYVICQWRINYFAKVIVLAATKKFSMTRLLRNHIVRVILFWVLFLLLWMAPLYSGLLPQPAGFRMWNNAICGCLAAFATTAIFLRMEKRSFADAGLSWQKGTLGRFLLGIGIGVVLFGSILLGTSVCLGSRPTLLPMDREWIEGIFILLLLSVAEEVGFRAYTLTRLEQAVGLRVAQWIVALAFALFHLAYGWNIWVALTGPFIWSFVFSLAAIKWRGIAVPVGLHFAINVLQRSFSVGAGNHNTPPAWPSLLVETVLFAGTLLLTEGMLRRKRKYFPE
jgi:membrane protease YdiL (CAAX protease family)